MLRASSKPIRGSKRRGVVLLAVLIVVAILTLASYGYYHSMTAEYEAVQACNRVAEVRASADSALHYAAFVLSYPDRAGISDEKGSRLISSLLAYDHPAVFHLRSVRGTSPHRQVFFSIVAPRDPDDPLLRSQGFRFGVEDESGKINLNALRLLDREGRARARWLLSNLPDVTEELAESMLSWMQPDGGKDGNGNADPMYYSLRGYAARHGPYESLDELLLVRGMTPQLLFGNDLNRNGVLEPEENDGSGILRPGLARYLTIYSRELNVDSQGQPRIYVNSPDLAALYETLNGALGEDLAAFILAYRIYGPAAGNFTEADVKIGGLTRADIPFDRSQKAQLREVRSLFELIGTDVEIRKPGEKPRVHRCPLRRADPQSLLQKLPLLLDRVTTSPEPELPARINVNTAPRAVLAALPEFTEDHVEAILEHRRAQGMDPTQAARYRTPAWLVTEAGWDPGFLQHLEPYITTRSQVFRVQVIGYYQHGGPMARLESVIDTNGGFPNFLFWRDLTELGSGFNPGVVSRR